MKNNANLKMQFLFLLRKAGIVDSQVLSAMERIDRQEFVKSIFSEKAYDLMNKIYNPHKWGQRFIDEFMYWLKNEY